MVKGRGAAATVPTGSMPAADSVGEPACAVEVWGGWERGMAEGRAAAWRDPCCPSTLFPRTSAQHFLQANTPALSHLAATALTLSPVLHHHLFSHSSKTRILPSNTAVLSHLAATAWTWHPPIQAADQARGRWGHRKQRWVQRLALGLWEAGEGHNQGLSDRRLHTGFDHTILTSRSVITVDLTNSGSSAWPSACEGKGRDTGKDATEARETGCQPRGFDQQSLTSGD